MNDIEIVIIKEIGKRKTKSVQHFKSEDDLKLYLRTLEKGLNIKYKIIQNNYLLFT